MSVASWLFYAGPFPSFAPSVTQKSYINRLKLQMKISRNAAETQRERGYMDRNECFTPSLVQSFPLRRSDFACGISSPFRNAETFH